MCALGLRGGMPMPEDDGWAILAQPPGQRDLARPEYWDLSRERSRRRREAGRRGRVGGFAPGGRARLTAVLGTAALAGPALATVAGGSAAHAAPSAAAVDLDLGRGSHGSAVAAVQRALGIAADGIFGPQTERAVRAFQRAHGIPATGHVGPLTTAALRVGMARSAPAAGTSSGAEAPAPAATLTRAQARAMQRALGVTADGIVGPRTRAALKAFEAAHGLPADGQPDARSLQALGVGRGAASISEDGSGTGGPGAPGLPGGTAPAPAPAAGVQAAIAAAKAKTGAPYRAGSTGPSAFDCSGLVVYAMKKAGISLPRTSFAQYATGTPISRSQIHAGDLVFFDTAGAGASDVGLAVSPTTAISATTHGVMEHPILTGYWGSHFVGARRVA